MDRDIATTLESLASRGLRGFYAEDREEGKARILDLVPREAVVGIGDSTTAAQIGIKEALKNKGTKVLDGFSRGILGTLHNELVKESTLCDVFLTGTNAVTLDGKLVNMDASGNRVAGMFYGHTMSVIAVGRNKLVENSDEASRRIRDHIAPNHIKIRVELGGRRVNTPCVATGTCNDCKSRDRMCNIFTVIEGKPLRTEVNVVIINEDLGLGWDESWPRERISRILEEYKRFVWIPAAVQPSGSGT